MTMEAQELENQEINTMEVDENQEINTIETDAEEEPDTLEVDDLLQKLDTYLSAELDDWRSPLHFDMHTGVYPATTP